MGARSNTQQNAAPSLPRSLPPSLLPSSPNATVLTGTWKALTIQASFSLGMRQVPRQKPSYDRRSLCTRAPEKMGPARPQSPLQHAAMWTPTRPLLSDIGEGGGGGVAPPPPPRPGFLADPPTHRHQRTFPQEKNEIDQRGPNLEINFRYTNLFWPLIHPPHNWVISTSR